MKPDDLLEEDKELASIPDLVLLSDEEMDEKSNRTPPTDRRIDTGDYLRSGDIVYVWDNVFENEPPELTECTVVDDHRVEYRDDCISVTFNDPDTGDFQEYCYNAAQLQFVRRPAPPPQE